LSNSLLDLVESTEAVVRESTFFQLPNFFPLLLGDNNPQRISFLTDWLRGMKITEHWDPEIKRIVICDKTPGQGKTTCVRCDKANEDRKDKEKPPKEKFTTSLVRSMFVYAHDKVGKKRPDREGKATQYDDEPVCRFKVRAGEANCVFDAFLNANGDLYDYCDEDKNPVKELLAKNLLMYTAAGDDVVWEVKKAVVNKKVSYPGPQIVFNINKVKDIQGNQVVIKRVPKEVRTRFDSMPIGEAWGYHLEEYPNVDWVEFAKYGVTKPPTREPAGTASANTATPNGADKV
jgi:hypothetical protein